MLTMQLSQKEASVRYVKGAFLTFFIDMFDIYAPLVFLAPAIEYFFPKTIPTDELIVYYSLIFGATLVGRPLGAIIFGYFTDHIGRRKTTLIVMSGFIILTFLLGCLPGYDIGGKVILYVFILLRFLLGVFLGGGYTSANPMAIENAPKEKRGLYAGIITSGMAVALVTASLITLLLLSIASKSFYMVYGWRVGFFLGALLGIFSFLYLDKHVPESILWEENKKEIKEKKPGFKTLLSGTNFKNLWQILILSTGMFLGVTAVYGTVSVIYTKVLHFSSALTATITLIAYTIMIITTILGSWWTDKIGRRRGILIYGLLIMFVAPAIYYYVINGVINGTLMVLLATAIIFAIAQFPVPVNVAYINERFPTKIRGLGYGIGYSLPVIIAGFFGFYQKTLSSIMPFKYTQLAILSFAGLLWFIGALIGPETKGIDLKELDKEA